MFSYQNRVDNIPDYVFQSERPLSFIKYVGQNTLFASDDRNNLIILEASTLRLIRSLPYGHSLRDCIGSSHHVFCAFEQKLVAF